MEKTKLTVRVRRDWLERAKRYARENNTTLTRLVSEYLRRLTTEYVVTRNIQGYNAGPLPAPQPAELLALLNP